ncbi:hypothetical protein HW130_34665 [Streptomyces sp. PKU-EA00015]|uniref:hypothetical protein n=1 Tax=Streptomyces sp. PKU-EA00015 TaxID=2748326 RepID=UPI0015A308DC|nr:hypothetical protein [Streptomyces sp. PKU-EA00015]NWF31302.1 hypothetical protein [Streptomyces sp. PKU-EA00015]
MASGYSAASGSSAKAYANGPHVGGNDLITIECVDDDCTNATLWLCTGNTLGVAPNNWQDQTEPFDLNTRVNLGLHGWRDYTNLALGDQNGDGIQDLLARDPSTGQLYLYPGRINNGVFSLGTRSVYGTASWQLRPHLASPGNVQGTVSTASYSDPDAGTSITYRQFQPTANETYGDLWATTPADPDLTVSYVDDTGAAKTTTCPTGCLLFYPGGPTTHRPPRLVGLSSWNTTIDADGAERASPSRRVVFSVHKAAEHRLFCGPALLVRGRPGRRVLQSRVISSSTTRHTEPRDHDDPTTR